jgi:hypothetical protein
MLRRAIARVITRHHRQSTLLERRMSRTDREPHVELAHVIRGSANGVTRHRAIDAIGMLTEISMTRGTRPIPDDLQIHMRRLCDLGPGPDVTVAWRGEPAPDKVVRAARLMKAHRVAFNVLAAVHAGNADRPLDVYHFLRDEVGARFIHLMPVVDAIVVRPVSPAQWGSFLIRMFDEWVRYDVGTVFVRVFDDLLLSWWGGRTPLHARQGTGDLNEGYHALFDHATQRWSQNAVSRL